MQKLIYVRPGGNAYSDEDRVIITAEKSSATRYVLGSPRGLGAVATRVLSAQAAGQDGAYLQGVALEPRTVTDTILVQGDTRAAMYANRARLIRILDPAQGMGTLYYHNDHGQWQIAAIPTVYGEAEERVSRNRCHVSVGFYCPDPYWRDLSPQKTTLYRKAHALDFSPDFPVTLPVDEYARFLFNTGNVPARADIVIHGPVRGLRLINRTTGTQLCASVTLQEGDTLNISADDRTIIRHSAAGIRETITPAYGFDYFVLAPGVNDMDFAYDYAAYGCAVVVSWTRQYAGV